MKNFDKTTNGSVKSRLLTIGAALLAISAINNSASADSTTTSEANAKKFDFEHVSCRGNDNEIRIRVTGVKKSVGLMSADLYPNDQEAFLKGPLRIKQVKFAAKSPVTQFCIKAPESGNFAIALYHDKNANGLFDKTGLGLPDEPWGISNNPKVRFAPPPITKALFDVPEEGIKLEIDLK